MHVFFLFLKIGTASALGLLAVITATSVMKDDYKEALAISRISKSEVALEDVTLSPVDNYAFHVSGFVQNLSQKYGLDKIEIRLIVHDCLGESRTQNCAMIDSALVFVDLYHGVPAGQGRHFDEHVYLQTSETGKDYDPHHPKGHLIWDYRVLNVWSGED